MNQEILTRVVERIADTTRYPKQVLTPEADLEIDLGIDSVKRVEIIVVLSEEFGLELYDENRDESIRTLADVANWIDGLLNRNRMEKTEVTEKTEEPEKPDSHFPDRPVPPKLGGSRFNSNRISGMEPIPAPHIPRSDHRTKPVRKNHSLEGRVALVTGSGRGVGRTVARVLAARGATVIVNSFHSKDLGEKTKDEICAQGENAAHIWGSVANPEHVESMFREIERSFGHLDILICNASDGRIGSFSDLGWDDWDRAFRTNVSGHHQCAVRAARLMQPRGGGSIVTMSAIGAHHFVEGLGSQGVVKAAVESLTKYLACELGALGVRTNCVAGGPIYGELLAHMTGGGVSQNHWEAMTPDGELCSPMDIAETISFLVSDEARGINGAIWTVDHGFSARGDGCPLRNGLREKMHDAVIQ